MQSSKSLGKLKKNMSDSDSNPAATTADHVVVKTLPKEYVHIQQGCFAFWQILKTQYPENITEPMELFVSDLLQLRVSDNTAKTLHFNMHFSHPTMAKYKKEIASLAPEHVTKRAKKRKAAAEVPEVAITVEPVAEVPEVAITVEPVAEVPEVPNTVEPVAEVPNTVEPVAEVPEVPNTVEPVAEVPNTVEPVADKKKPVPLTQAQKDKRNAKRALAKTAAAAAAAAAAALDVPKVVTEIAAVEIVTQTVTETAVEIVTQTVTETAVEIVTETAVAEPVADKKKPAPLTQAQKDKRNAKRALAKTAAAAAAAALEVPRVNDAETTVEPVVETTTEPVVETTTEPVVETTTEPVVETTAEPAVKADAKKRKAPTDGAEKKKKIKPATKDATAAVSEVDTAATAPEIDAPDTPFPSGVKKVIDKYPELGITDYVKMAVVDNVTYAIVRQNEFLLALDINDKNDTFAATGFYQEETNTIEPL